jgi:glycyl-tRNA synthetase beta chain
MQQTLLVELLTEELPPKALPRLGETFAAKIFQGLTARQLADASAAWRWYATPRRLAITVPGVAVAAPERQVTEKIMPVAVAMGADGEPSPALKKKLEAKGIAVSEISKFEKRMDGKSETFFYTFSAPGATLAGSLEGIVREAVSALPIPKLMRWGDGEAQFVRPVHKLIMMHGGDVVPGTVLDLQAGNVTRGHRFMSRGEIAIAQAGAYEETLRAEGKVIADFSERRAEIERALVAGAAAQNASLGDYQALLGEVTALVEHPTVYVGMFEEEFLAVPQECLILTMKANQKYFPLFDASGKLLNRFLIVSNMNVADPKHIIGGNQRVVRPRLSDARFFYNQDRKKPLESRVLDLAKVVYHNKLGTLGERVQRVSAIARAIGRQLGGESLAMQADQAALLTKADLVTDMVGEFPELQGIMGRYYALHDGLAVDVADAIEDHYKPRFAGDSLPRGQVGLVVALADKLETLVGMFGIGQIPTGDKDPFALRRHALGVIRMLIEGGVNLPLDWLLTTTAEVVGPVIHANQVISSQPSRHGSATVIFGTAIQPNTISAVTDFIYDRLTGSLREQGYTAQEVDAVVSQRPKRLGDIPPRLEAVREFAALPEAVALAAANKRIVNILKKSEAAAAAAEVDVALLQEDAERELFRRVNELGPSVKSLIFNEDYTGALKALAGLRDVVDRFFDQVMVNADEPLIRANRLALLARLASLMNGVADISKL